MSRMRKGTAAIELAIALPVFMFFMTCLYQYCHAQMTLSLLRSGARIGARYGTMGGVTSAAAITKAGEIVGAGVPLSQVTISIKDASVFDGDGPYPTTDDEFDALPDLELTNAEERQMFLVRATVQYDAVAVLRLPFFRNLRLTGQSVMRHE